MKKTILFFSLFLMTTSLLFAQDLSVSGTVSDSSGEVLPGVSIIIKGTNSGTSTDFDGNYSINASKGDVLVFSFLGFHSKDVTVTGANHNVSLDEDTSQLDEVVITAFGIKKKEKTLGFAVQQVNADDLDMSGQNSGIEALQGRVAGLRINRTSGSAGGGVDMMIRGLSSIDPSRSNQPLIVVDGVAINNDTFTGNVLPSSGSNAVNSSEQFGFSSRGSDINPDDIESYSVLKGAAASALYGVRASNGAIIITTKKGKLGKPKFRISTSSTFRNVVTTPDLQTTYREGHRTSKRPGVTIDPSATNNDGYNRFSWAFYSWGVPYTDDSFEQADGTITDLSNDKFYSPYDLFQTAMNNKVNFNVSGADDKFDYFFSLGNNKDNGILPNTSYNKTSLRIKGGYKMSDKLTMSSSMAFTNSGGARANGGDKSVFSSMSYWSATFPINDYQNKDGSQKNYTPGYIDNPRYFLETSNLKDDVNRWVANAKLSWDPLEAINVSFNTQIDNYSDVRNRFVPADLDTGTQVGGFIVNENINYTGFESTLLATYTKYITEDLEAKFMIGNQVSQFERSYAFIRGEGLNVPGINELGNTTNKFAGTSVRLGRNVGLFGDFRLAYKDQLFLTVTGRNDWESTLPLNSNTVFYPSYSLSYLFHNLFEENDIFTFGKFRTSWAAVGKGPKGGSVGHYSYSDSSFPFGGTGGYVSGILAGDVNLKPELSKSFEIGTDLRFFNNKVKLDYSYYKIKVEDQIFKVAASQSSGLSSYLRNAGDFATWGHEFLLSANIINNDDFSWETTLNYATNGGEITSLPDDMKEVIFFSDRITNKAKVGDPIGTLYGWKFQTINGERYVNSDGKWVITGDKNDGYFYENDNEMVIVGNAFPDYIATLGERLTYKGLGLNVLLEYKKGGDIYDKGMRNSIRNGNLLETEFRDETRVLEGVMDDGSGGYTANTQETMISANNYYRDWNNYNSSSEVLLQDGSWLKIRSIGLSYDFGKLLQKAVKIDRFSISASANNILLWTPFKGYDPEGNYFSAGSNIYGYNGLSVPLSRGYSLGLNIEF